MGLLAVRPVRKCRAPTPPLPLEEKLVPPPLLLAFKLVQAHDRERCQKKHPPIRAATKMSKARQGAAAPRRPQSGEPSQKRAQTLACANAGAENATPHHGCSRVANIKWPQDNACSQKPDTSKPKDMKLHFHAVSTADHLKEIIHAGDPSKASPQKKNRTQIEPLDSRGARNPRAHENPRTSSVSASKTVS